VSLDHFEVKAEGKAAEMTPKAPVEEGAEIRLELVEVGLHDVNAGMGKLDGLGVCVADAAKLIGKKVKVRVERVVDGTAYATLVQPVGGSADGPITAEAEAEKPTRAPRKKKIDEAVKVEEQVPEAEIEAVAAAEVEEPPTDEPPADEAEKPKKKTRRGSRGGRNRRKKPAATAAAENGQPKPEPKPEPEAAPAVATIHVPSPDLGQDAEAKADGDQPPKKKRTRRGSRGGRNRRKKPAAAASEAKPESSGG